MSGWPALRAKRAWRARLDVEQAVWGKVHRQASDFRCIAASPGFEPSALGPALGAGAEDRPARCVFWRLLDDGRAAAVAAYPSRAVDAAGRSGFLERRVYLWRPESGVSIVRGLLALLPEVEGLPLEHELARTPGDWLRPDFRLKLDRPQIEADEAALDGRAERGRQRLVEALGEPELVAAYARLFAGQRPVVLPSPKPFSAEMLAALLLPLAARQAAEISLAGWVPSSRASIKSLAENWRVLVGELVAPPCEPSPEMLESARRTAKALIAGDPSRLDWASPPSSSPASSWSPDAPTDSAEDLRSWPERRGHREDSTFEALEKATRPRFESAWLTAIRSFVADPGARWLDPECLARDSPLDEGLAPQLETWRRTLESSMPSEADVWQWSVKVDLLTALLVAVAPAAAEAAELDFLSGRVPALLFVAHLEGDRLAAWRRQCPEHRLAAWRRQSGEIRRRERSRRR